jgi:ABC-type multidrug transport system fused ATPase/permease subunit
MIKSLKKWLNFFDRKSKIKFFFLISLILVINSMEVIGIGVLYPLIENLVDKPNSLLNDITFQYPFIDIKTVIVALILIYFFKSILSIYFFYKKNKLIYEIQKNITESFYVSKLKNDYKYFLNNNSSIIINDILVEIDKAIGHLKSTIAFIADTILLVFICVTLFIINPYITIFSLLILVMLIIPMFKYLKIINTKIGDERLFYDERITKLVKETFSVIKYIKVTFTENFFINIFSKYQVEKTKKYTQYSTLLEIPRVAIEFLIISIFLGSLITLVIYNIDINELLPIIGVFTLATFKLMPSINKLTNSYQNIFFYGKSLKIIEHDYTDERKLISKSNNLEFKKDINFRNISFRYSEDQKKLFSNQNFKIEKNKIIGIKGESGSGKSTLIDLFSGILTPSNADIYVDGINVSFDFFSKNLNVGYVSQQTYLIDDSIKNNIAFGIKEENIDIDNLNNIIKASDISSFIQDKPNFLETIVGENGVQLSGGQVQRIGIARALYNKPDILILDEFTSSLDEETEKKILNTIKKLKSNTTVIMSSHKNSTLKICDKLYNIVNGKIVLSE